jgi:hypothetical protein
METPTTSIEEAVANYVAAWNEPDPAPRARLLEQAVAEDVRIALDRREVRGRGAVAAEIAELHRRLPGVRGRLSTAVDVQGNVCRFAAQVERADGTSVAEMLDACECDASGRLRLILTFAGASIPRRDAPVE